MSKPIFVDFTEANRRNLVTINTHYIVAVREQDNKNTTALWLHGAATPTVVNGTVDAVLLKIYSAALG